MQQCLILEIAKKIKAGAVGQLSTLRISIARKNENIDNVLCNAVQTCLNIVAADTKIKYINFQGNDSCIQGIIRFRDGSICVLDVDAVRNKCLNIEAQGSLGLIVLPEDAQQLKVKIKNEKQFFNFNSCENFNKDIKNICKSIKKSIQSGSILEIR